MHILKITVPVLVCRTLAILTNWSLKSKKPSFKMLVITQNLASFDQHMGVRTSCFFSITDFGSEAKRWERFALSAYQRALRPQKSAEFGLNECWNDDLLKPIETSFRLCSMFSVVVWLKDNFIQDHHFRLIATCAHSFTWIEIWNKTPCLFD